MKRERERERAVGRERGIKGKPRWHLSAATSAPISNFCVGLPSLRKWTGAGANADKWNHHGCPTQADPPANPTYIYTDIWYVEPIARYISAVIDMYKGKKTL